MGAEGLEPSRPCGQRIFILLQLSLLLCVNPGFENWTLPLPASTIASTESRRWGSSRRVSAPSKKRMIPGLAQDCPIRRSPDLGFPEFESGHLASSPAKAQISKSVASTIPPCPHEQVMLVEVTSYHSTIN